MTQTPTPGSDTPATFGGPGFRARTTPHIEELGVHWAAIGVHSEHLPLRAALLRWPGQEMCYTEPPDHWLHLQRPDLDVLRRQAEGIARVLESEGCAVHWLREEAPSPNLLFLRDAFWMTPEGAIVGRMGSVQRAGEAQFTTRALAGVGAPILSTPRGTATFEGADALWLDAQTVFVGMGRRTNTEGLQHLQHTLAHADLDWQTVILPSTTQHLLGILNFLDHDHVCVWDGRTPQDLIDALHHRGFRILHLPDGPELSEGRAMNWVCLGPSTVLMPAGCPDTAVRLRAAGIRVLETDVSAYRQAGGALGCLVGILARR